MNTESLRKQGELSLWRSQKCLVKVDCRHLYHITPWRRQDNAVLPGDQAKEQQPKLQMLAFYTIKGQSPSSLIVPYIQFSIVYLTEHPSPLECSHKLMDCLYRYSFHFIVSLVLISRTTLLKYIERSLSIWIWSVWDFDGKIC